LTALGGVRVARRVLIAVVLGTLATVLVLVSSASATVGALTIRPILAGDTVLTGGVAVDGSGNIWLETGAPLGGSATVGQFERIAPDGTITDFLGDPRNNGLRGFVTGADGAVYTETVPPGTAFAASQIGRVDAQGNTSWFWPPALNRPLPSSVVSGPDGNLWFIESENPPAGPPLLGRMTTEGTFTISPPLPLTVYEDWSGLTVGPDGALWFQATNGSGQSEIVRYALDGSVKTFPLPTGDDIDISETAVGGDGALWFFVSEGSVIRLGRMTTDGQFSSFTVPSPMLQGLTRGGDGNLWYVSGSAGAASVVRVSVSGQVTTFPLPALSAPTGVIATAPDGDLLIPDPGEEALDEFATTPEPLSSTTTTTTTTTALPGGTHPISAGLYLACTVAGGATTYVATDVVSADAPNEVSSGGPVHLSDIHTTLTLPSDLMAALVADGARSVSGSTTSIPTALSDIGGNDLVTSPVPFASHPVSAPALTLSAAIPDDDDAAQTAGLPTAIGAQVVIAVEGPHVQLTVTTAGSPLQITCQPSSLGEPAISLGTTTIGTPATTTTTASSTSTSTSTTTATTSTSASTATTTTGSTTTTTRSSTTTTSTTSRSGPPPVVSWVAPNRGHADTIVAIVGQRFTHVDAVRFGAHDSPWFLAITNRLIVALAPPGERGSHVPVTVSTAGGTSAKSFAATFTYAERQRH